MLRVAVLGGGPGGASAALALARGGSAVDLYVPQRPGEKPCGGAVPDYLVADFPGFDPTGLPAVVAPRAVLENADGSRLALDLGGIRIYRRRDFDAALVRAAREAGAEAIRTKAERLLWRREGPAVGAAGGERRYDWVVGADGARGLSRRTLGLAPEGESVGLGASLAGVAAGNLVLAFPGAGDAYLWVFPRPGGASVGIAYSPDSLSHGAARALLRGFVERRLGPPAADLPGPRYRYPIPVFTRQTIPGLHRAVARGVLLVGDAAALADPLTREGIRWAVRSGGWAADCLLSGRPELYPHRVEAELGEEMGRALSARSLFFDDPIGQWMVPVSRALPGVRRVLGDLLACRQPYRGLRRRLVASTLAG